MLAVLLQHLAQGQDRAQAIAVGADVRRQQQPFVGRTKRTNGFQSIGIAFLSRAKNELYLRHSLSETMNDNDE